jgi:uracil-DNA glycosylase
MNTQIDLFQTSQPALTWKDVLKGEKEQPYFLELIKFVAAERAAGKKIYPPAADVFNSMQYTSFADVKVVLLGQDPYHGPGQAHGLCFSVRPGVPPPPSLVNMFKELQSDLQIPIPSHGNLEKWARQGVLLLNAVLTVEEGKPGSHANRGWERFTDRVIRELNDHKEGLVFLLWGAYAQKKGEIINSSRHTVLKAPHPSPFSADRGFFGCRHFSKTNAALKPRGLTEVDWSL